MQSQVSAIPSPLGRCALFVDAAATVPTSCMCLLNLRFPAKAQGVFLPLISQKGTSICIRNSSKDWRAWTDVTDIFFDNHHFRFKGINPAGIYQLITEQLSCSSNSCSVTHGNSKWISFAYSLKWATLEIRLSFPKAIYEFSRTNYRNVNCLVTIDICWVRSTVAACARKFHCVAVNMVLSWCTSSFSGNNLSK